MTASETAIVITREFDAPRDLVWSVWTEPKHVEKWWGPRGFNSRVIKMENRVGGKWQQVMIGPDGTEYPVSGVILEWDPPRRIVSRDEFDEGFEDIPAMEGVELPKGIILTSEFDDLGTRTRLTLTITHATPEDRRKHADMGVVEGWNSSFECMDDYLVELQEGAQ